MTGSQPVLTSLRIDKWLHHVRIFKTRTLAAAACNKSNVRVADQVVKPARDVRVGDVVQVQRGELTLILQVVALPPVRLGASYVDACLEDLTPEENYAKAAAARQTRQLTELRPHQTAFKPTKKDLREIREWLGRE
jgi:ribosome-associated heat shock protein Hsp15